MPETLSVKDRIKGAKRERRVHKINLRGDLVAEIERLDAELEKLTEEARNKVSSGAARLGGNAQDLTENGKVAKRILNLREEMNDSWLELTLEAQGWDKWQQFKLSNPPRDDVEEDKLAGINFDALVRDFLPTCVVEPVLDDEDWDGLFKTCAAGDLRDLGGIAYGLHQRSLDVPLSRLASATIARISADSGPQEPGESASDGSTDGPLPSSTSTSTTSREGSLTPS